jgi:TetR/AcrR family fatty acid metabolism transcriptional regulator
VVQNFWAELTKGALIAVDVSLAVMTQLEQLATYHLAALIQQSDMVGLTYRARLRHGEPEYQLLKIREYVRVFDQIMERGINRKELSEALPLWQCRDVFYGALEYSSRTLLLREAQFDPSVVKQLLVMFQPYTIDQNPAVMAGQKDSSISNRLEKIESQLAKLLIDRESN